MEETGVVLSTNGTEATVMFERTEACKKCGACKLGQDGEMLLRVDNRLGAKAGDRVSVALEERQLFAASLLAYGLPLVGLLGGLGLGSLLSRMMPALNPDAAMVGGALVLTAAAFMVNRILEPKRRSKHKYQPVPVKIHDEHKEDT